MTNATYTHPDQPQTEVMSQTHPKETAPSDRRDLG